MKTVLSVGALAMLVPATSIAGPESYTLDPPHSIPAFSVDYIGFTTIRGYFPKSSGKFTIDRVARTGSLEYVVETASITTGDLDRGSRPRTRDEHLRTPDFFNVAEFPRMSFKAGNVKFSGDHPTEFQGELTMLGVTRPVSIKVERWKCAMHPFYKKEACGGDAVARVKRSDFGMKYGLPMLGDDITLHLSFLGMKD